MTTNNFSNEEHNQLIKKISETSNLYPVYSELKDRIKLLALKEDNEKTLEEYQKLMGILKEEIRKRIDENGYYFEYEPINYKDVPERIYFFISQQNFNRENTIREVLKKEYGLNKDELKIKNRGLSTELDNAFLYYVQVVR